MDIFKDEDKTVKLMKRYREHRKLVKGGLAKSSKFSLLQVQQEWARSVGSTLINEGYLMCKRCFLVSATAIFFMLLQMCCLFVSTCVDC